MTADIKEPEDIGGRPVVRLVLGPARTIWLAPTAALAAVLSHIPTVRFKRDVARSAWAFRTKASIYVVTAITHLGWRVDVTVRGAGVLVKVTAPQVTARTHRVLSESHKITDAFNATRTPRQYEQAFRTYLVPANRVDDPLTRAEAVLGAYVVTAITHLGLWVDVTVRGAGVLVKVTAPQVTARTHRVLSESHKITDAFNATRTPRQYEQASRTYLVPANRVDDPLTRAEAVLGADVELLTGDDIPGDCA